MTDEPTLADVARRLKDAERVVVFTGAGVSAESGIPPFRSGADGSMGGLWAEFPPEQFATPGGLLKLVATEPARVAKFLHALLGPVASATPNLAHRALAHLEDKVTGRGHDLVVVTQNVDRLHQDAGSKHVLEVHGSLFRLVDRSGLGLGELSREDLTRVVAELDKAQRGLWKRTRLLRAIGRILGPSHRPDVVLFGEELPERVFARAVEKSERAQVFVVVGTSGLVYPAASLPHVAKEKGAYVVGVGPDETDLPVDAFLRGTAADVMPRLVDRV